MAIGHLILQPPFQQLGSSVVVLARLSCQISEHYTQWQESQSGTPAEIPANVLNEIEAYVKLDKDYKLFTEEYNKLKQSLKDAVIGSGLDGYQGHGVNVYYSTKKSYEYSDAVKQLSNKLKELKKKEEQSGKLKTIETKTVNIKTI